MAAAAAAASPTSRPPASPPTAAPAAATPPRPSYPESSTPQKPSENRAAGGVKPPCTLATYSSPLPAIPGTARQHIHGSQCPSPTATVVSSVATVARRLVLHRSENHSPTVA